MALPLFLVDAFTGTSFAGNPAAVCLLPAARDERWMQDVAREMNQAETAFLVPAGDGFDLRWFTPTLEVDLCGHATLASAHVLWQAGRLPSNAQARFHTRSGLLTASQRGDWIELDFPAEPASSTTVPPPLAPALGAPLKYVGKNRMDYLVEVDSEATLRSLKPDLVELTKIPVRGIIVTCRADDRKFDFVSRFFAPRAGVNEDPVTGSAHCCLGPFWARRLHKHELLGFQASARGGVVRVTLAGDRVRLGGQAVTIVKGELQAT